MLPAISALPSRYWYIIATAEGMSTATSVGVCTHSTAFRRSRCRRKGARGAAGGRIDLSICTDDALSEYLVIFSLLYSERCTTR